MVEPATPGILHVDLDAFYASVEQLDDPALRGRPVVVGGLGPRGVVAAASYEARRFGIHSAMPMARARRACPDAVFLAPRFERYRAASDHVLAILRSFTPLVEPIALDEAFLDVRGARRLQGSGPEVGAEIRARVRAETGLTTSVGVAPTKLVAKLASELAKPDGMLVVEPDRVLEMLHPLPVERLWGVGPATAGRLHDLGIRTVEELAAVPEATLRRAVGEAHGSHLHAMAWNHDDRAVEPDRVVKSIGHEQTFAADVTDAEVLDRNVLALADRVVDRLRAGGLTARRVQLKLRWSVFRTLTRSRTLPEPTNRVAVVASTARALLETVLGGSWAAGPRPVRLLGVAVSRLEPVGADIASGRESAGEGAGAWERSIEAVRQRYGADALRPARLVEAPGARRTTEAPPPGASR